ncbi:class I adenylate-forming enzyme family protein [Amycolatopsis thermophila]|uniref:Fatty-acyl-CoA synthase n=1 Tax=Amycolatopsis thermophila TaxID=206084 RepID=A0ABU0F4K2_9PSEU|nr:AMP-binding protein [Amycolatopsis thermophila]MDQ0382500.1 fatty-acyl-CoA synthase [Amycolatopsis thermophila]
MTADGPSIAERRADLEREFAPWRPRTLDEHFEHAAARFGPRPYVIAGDRVLTYDDVLRQAHRFADGLAALGVRPGDHVAVLMANYPEYAPLKLAISRAGAVAVPLNYLYRTHELGFVLRQSCARVLITMTSYRDLDYLAMLDELAPGWSGTGSIGFGDLERVITFDAEGRGEGRECVADVPELARIGEQNPGAAPGGRRSPEQMSDIMYTSGTTGEPKGVQLSHDALLRQEYGSAFCRALPDGNRVVFALPCYHMFGYEHGVQSTTFVGGAMLPQPRFDAGEYLRAIERHRVNDVLAVPTMSVALVEHPDRTNVDLSSLTRMLSAAAVAPTWLWQRIRDDLGVRELTTAYGMTEVAGATVMTQPDDPLEVTASTVGRPKLGGAAAGAAGTVAEYRILDPVTHEPVRPGETGELVSRGPTTMLGYWNRPDATEATLRDGWLYSGDLGRVLDDGSLVITGRSKDVFKSGGELVMPKEVEDFLTTRPGVSQAFVVGVPDDRWGEAGCAFVVPEPGATPDPGQLLEACRSALARFKVPRHVFVLDTGAVPQTPTGKVQKFKLVPMAQRLLGADASAVRALSPADPA